MLPALTSLTGGGGLNASASSSTGAVSQGGDKFNQTFGGLNKTNVPWYFWGFMVVLVLVVGFIALKVFT